MRYSEGGNLEISSSYHYRVAEYLGILHSYLLEKRINVFTAAVQTRISLLKKDLESHIGAIAPRAFV